MKSSTGGKVEMGVQENTLTGLQYLVTLYRQGHRNPVIDLAVEKLVALERQQTRRKAAELQARLTACERQYQMTSDDFYRRFRAGELGDTMEMMEWSVFYEMWVATRQRLTLLETQPA